MHSALVEAVARFHQGVGHDVYEVKIDDEFLMSSLFTVVESELAHLGLVRVKGERLHVLVGGLGLGYTLRAALEDDRVEQVQVIEAVAAVIDWHRRDLLPTPSAWRRTRAATSSRATSSPKSTRAPRRGDGASVEPNALLSP